MKTTMSFGKRLLSMCLVMAFMLTVLPLYAFAVEGSSQDAVLGDRIADPSTMDAWKALFPTSGDITTENAGAVWMDKSVFTDASAFAGLGITRDDPNGFLVALSAMAANMSVTGVANAPTDTVIVLDLSSSMYNGSARTPGTVQTMLTSVNNTITELQKLNVNNRVGVVVYYGGVDRNQSDKTNSMVLLPLDRYTGTATFLKANLKSGKLNSVSVNSGVKNSAGKTMPQTTRTVTDVAGTYAQLGLLDAMNQLLAADTVVPSTAEFQPGAARTPIVVFMSDGEPTAATHDFTKKVDAGMGNNTISIRSPNETDFVTQLTAAYVKERVDQHYEQMDALFYSLSLGTSVSLAVMDPANHTPSAIDTYWNNLLKNGSVKLTVYNSPNGWSSPTVKKTYTVSKTTVGGTAFPSNKEQRNYVDKAFTASTANQLASVFGNIIKQINLVSKYTPTLASGNADLSGYVSFVDRIGEYMNVTDVKGILIDQHLFSGADLASNFVEGGGALGSYDTPTELGLEMVASVRARLGLDSDDTARALIFLAYENGQLSYTDENNYSNYIGWYANAAGQFLGFYHEGVTVLPDPTGNAATDPAFTIRSYGYLGEVDESHGVSKSDMMYATVQVRKNIANDEELVTFAVPAALIPIVSYDVSLGENGDMTDLVVSGADAPIRLVYEVALRSDIHPYNVLEKLSDEYLADPHNVNRDGSVNFYTNQWNHENKTGYGSVNTYSYFNPSRQNDRYYYLDNTPVYTDDAGTLYKGEARPTGTMYRAYTVYTKGSAMKTEIHYRALSAQALDTAVRAADGSWYIPKGNVHVNLDGYTVHKTENLTGTLTEASVPFVDTTNHAVNDTGYRFYVGATLGNNGKLSMMPETGIKLSKTMAEDATAPSGAFTFLLTNLTNQEDSKAYTAWLVKADGSEETVTVQFEGGSAKVQLHANEVLYIGGMTAGESFGIEEEQTVTYIDKASGLDEKGSVTLVAGAFVPVSFVNSDRGTGNLSIYKEVTHDFGADYRIPEDKIFEMKVTLSGVGTANATFKAMHSGGGYDEITTDEKGSFTVRLRHEEEFEVFGLPAGTVATVVETNHGKGFAPAYLDNGVQGDGIVTVVRDASVAVIVVNDYTPDRAYPVNVEVSVDKALVGRDWLSTDSFTFVLQKYMADGSWQQLGSEAVATKDRTKLSFDGAFANEGYDVAGVYYYRVVEIEPNDPIAGVTYDKTVHSFYIVVTDADMDGALEIAEVKTDRTERIDIEKNENLWSVSTHFENTYTVNGSATVTVDVNKRVENRGGNAQSAAGFTFGLFDETGAPVGSTLVTTERGFARFVLTYGPEDAGKTYIYTLKEIAPATIPDGWTYSDTEYKVTVQVTDTNLGTLSATVYVGEEAPTNKGNTASADFTNVYDPTDVTLTVDFVKKELAGRDLKDGEFTFELRDADSGKTLLHGKNTPDGKVVFDGTLIYDRVGNYHYAIVETSSDKNGVTSDKTVYLMGVYVTDENGTLKATYVFANAIGDSVTFKNVYTPAPVQNVIEGVKVLRGRGLLNDEFTFVLTERAVDGVTVETPAKWSVKNFADGNFAFPAITYSKVGVYEYSVEEVRPAGNKAYGITYDTTVYKVVVTVADDGLGKLYIASERITLIDDSATNGLVFVNQYVPSPTFAEITGDKQLVGKVNNTLSGGEFTFELYESDANWGYNESTLIESVQNGANGVFAFGKLNYDTVGDYYYVVTEKNGGMTIDGVTYDASVYRVRMEVVDDHKGNLHATPHIEQVLIVEGDELVIPADSILFVNSYEVTGDAEITLSGEKHLEGRDFTAEDDFRFILSETDENYAAGGKLLQTVTADAKTHRFSFTLTYTAVDVGNVYYYLLSEVNGGELIDGVRYDSTVYRIRVSVEDNGIGGIRTVVTTEGTATDALNFVNVYTSEPTSTTLEGNKTLSGRDLVSGEFTFELYSADANFGIDKLVETVQNDANGSFRFGAIEFNKAGIYRFVVKEDNTAALGGVKYDSTVYYVTVTVTDNGKGNLVVTDTAIEKMVGEQRESVRTIVFANEYTTDYTSTTLEGNKTLSGRDLVSGEFTFELYSADASFGIDKLIETVQNDANGSFRFGAIEFNKAGIYRFVVKEDSSAALGGVKYDSTVYYVTVTVTDDGKGNLVVTDTAIEKAVGEQRESVRTIVFANEYNTDFTTTTLEGNKTLSGRDLVSGEFTFELYSADASFGIDKLIEAVQNDANGTFRFGAIEFTKAGTYYFVIVEDDSVNADRVTFDPTVYNVKIVVTDDGQGHLVASEPEITLADGSIAHSITFQNVYTPRPNDLSIDLTVNKTVVNVGKNVIGPENFRFLVKSENGEWIVVTDENGKALFGLTFDEEDIGKSFTYVISEINDGLEYVQYSTAEYTVTVTVSLDEATNTLFASYTVNGEAVTEIVTAFENVYDYTPPVQSGDATITSLFVTALSVIALGGLWIYRKRRLL